MKRSIVYPSVCLSHRSTAELRSGFAAECHAGGDIDRHLWVSALSSNDIAEWHSAANAGSVLLTAEVRG